MRDPLDIAKKAESLYREKLKSELEQKHFGKFVAIDVGSGDVFIADTPEGALEKAREAKPTGFFHAIKIGSEAVYRSTSLRADWIFQR